MEEAQLTSGVAGVAASSRPLSSSVSNEPQTAAAVDAVLRFRTAAVDGARAPGGPARDAAAAARLGPALASGCGSCRHAAQVQLEVWARARWWGRPWDHCPGRGPWHSDEQIAARPGHRPAPGPAPGASGHAKFIQVARVRVRWQPATLAGLGCLGCRRGRGRRIGPSRARIFRTVSA